MQTRLSIPLGALALLLTASVARATPATARITERIDGNDTVVLAGNTRPEATARNDRGALPEGTVLHHLQLLLKRSAEQEQELAQLTDDLQKPESASYHQWLSASDLGDRFGVASDDVARVTGWLEAQGFTVNNVHPSRLLIDFTGTVGQVRDAFHTEIHALDVNGAPHIANMSDPRIPAALAPVVAGIVSLHDFFPRPKLTPKSSYTFDNGGYQAVAPADLATIYNFNPLFASGQTGQFQTIAVLEDTDLYSTSDWSTFRSTFGLSSYKGSLQTVNPQSWFGRNNCEDPGVNGDDFEAILDAEWASAAAPSATIQVAACANTETNFGVLIALENVLAQRNTPGIISISYGACEAYLGTTYNQAFKVVYQLAAAEGVSLFVAAGDEGAASCDADEPNATHGIGVSGLASTPYNVAVGGTDFGDSYAGTNGSYWSATNGATYGSALSYVPEIPWNDSCASGLISSYLGYATPYGISGFCNSEIAAEYGLVTTAAGSGGPSGCAFGNAGVNTGIVSGDCQGYPKPSWQSVLGNPDDRVRDIPDVALFAANGVWGHYYVVCYSDPNFGGGPCVGAPDGWAGGGGTSFASPIMAGIQSLVNQKWGTQGLPAPTYYQIASQEYGWHGDTACNSTSGNAASSSCTFYDVTLGDMDVNCSGLESCYDPSGTYGVLSTSDTSDKIAFGATTGWDFATGIGSVNAANLVNNRAWAPSFSCH